MLVLKDPAPGSAELGYVRRAVEQGELVLVPTDTIYGIAAMAADADAVARLYAFKGRDAAQPTAVVFASIAQLHEVLPRLGARTEWAIQSLLPGPWTLVVDNAGGFAPWLTGGAPGPIGVRVPAGALALPPLAATSANRAGEPTIQAVRELDAELADGIACAVDRGELPTGGDSTILDLTAWARGEGDVRVLRDTRGRAGHALAVLADAPEANRSGAG
jgi:L-threonylcarbamoyladenylate synthase